MIWRACKSFFTLRSRCPRARRRRVFQLSNASIPLLFKFFESRHKRTKVEKKRLESQGEDQGVQASVIRDGEVGGQTFPPLIEIRNVAPPQSTLKMSPISRNSLRVESHLIWKHTAETLPCSRPRRNRCTSCRLSEPI